MCFPTWFIIYSVTLLRESISSTCLLFPFSVLRKKLFSLLFFLWKFNFLFWLFFFSLSLSFRLVQSCDEDLVRNVLIYGKPEISLLPLFFHESRCSPFPELSSKQSWIYYLSFRWCMSFNLHFINGKAKDKDGGEKRVTRRIHIARVILLPFCILTDKTKVNKSP